MIEIDKELLADLIGEKELKRPKALNFSLVRLHGTKGNFVKVGLADGGGYGASEDIGQAFKGVIVSVRRSLGSIKSDRKTKKISYTRYSNEYDGNNDLIRIWETIQGTTARIGEGSYKEIRDKFQDLRSRWWLYMLDENREIIKFQVKGAGLGNLFDYFRELDEAGKHIFEVETLINPSEEEGELGKYFATVFSIGEEVKGERLALVALKIQELSKNFKEIKERYQSTRVEPKLDEVNQGLSEKKLPEVDYDDY